MNVIDYLRDVQGGWNRSGVKSWAVIQLFWMAMGAVFWVFPALVDDFFFLVVICSYLSTHSKHVLIDGQREWLILRGWRRGDFFSASFLVVITGSAAHALGMSLFIILPQIWHEPDFLGERCRWWFLVWDGSILVPIVAFFLFVAGMKQFAVLQGFTQECTGCSAWELRVLSIVGFIVFLVLPFLERDSTLAILLLAIIVVIEMAGALFIMERSQGRYYPSAPPTSGPGRSRTAKRMSVGYSPVRALLWRGTGWSGVILIGGMVITVFGAVLLAANYLLPPVPQVFFGDPEQAEKLATERDFEVVNTRFFLGLGIAVAGGVLAVAGAARGIGNWSGARDRIEFFRLRGVGLATLVRCETFVYAGLVLLPVLAGLVLSLTLFDSALFGAFLLVPMWILCLVSSSQRRGWVLFVELPLSLTPGALGLVATRLFDDADLGRFVFLASSALALAFFSVHAWTRAKEVDYRNLPSM